MLQKSINDKKFNDVFVEVPYLETLGQHANEQLRLFRMKEVISNRFSKTSLQDVPSTRNSKRKAKAATVSLLPMTSLPSTVAASAFPTLG